MKPSFDQLPEKKQHEIRMIVEFIKQVVDPEMVILFGSYAKNTFVEDRYISEGTVHEYISDYDFLVVTKESIEKTYELENKILEMADKFDPPVNLEIHGVDFINKGLEWGSYFWVDIIEEGIVLYDKQTVSFKRPRPLSALERKTKALGHFETWFPRAQKLLKGAHFYYKEGDYNLSDFQLHQTAETLYYTVLLVFTDYKPKVHNLWKLRKKAKPYSEELHIQFRTETDKNDERLFELLKQGYIEARYKPIWKISEPDTKLLIDRIEKMITIVERICTDHISKID
ncbi:HEPN domain-containing protein [Paraflavitalea pollutisoli]|uniref:HEPN domain-containing protein n=1 Tax=Paraflavitalea pollutisoli TaxID=3034143 RepID=UPI0023ECDB7A|nr:HEPN domain-containing protein [Paraflavitalea sp. H1-2-19X]